MPNWTSSAGLRPNASPYVTERFLAVSQVACVALSEAGASPALMEWSVRETCPLRRTAVSARFGCGVKSDCKTTVEGLPVFWRACLVSNNTFSEDGIDQNSSVTEEYW